MSGKIGEELGGDLGYGFGTSCLSGHESTKGGFGTSCLSGHESTKRETIMVQSLVRA